ncbi:MAG: DUF5703 domain-containing protein, partial [Prevotellaceae bacterium]|nr:DUF5703 domain-containing protein [Prevotellaceae bacterium]
MRHTLSIALCFLTLNIYANQLSDYNVIWRSQSKNSSESMPCGGGDIGLNVWVENGELLFYMSRSGTFDENNAFLKLGRVKVKFTPNPFENSTSFAQKLTLNEGCIKIGGKNSELSTEIKLWVDVFNPVIHLEVKSSKPTKMEACYESWRHQDRRMSGKSNNANSYKWAPQGEVYTYKDSVLPKNSSILFFHRNRNNVVSVFDITVKQQGLDSLKDKMFNPIKNLTFGGIIQGENLKYTESYMGKYVDTDFKGYKLQSSAPTKQHNLNVFLHVAQTETLNEWKKGLQDIISNAEKSKKTAQKNTLAWWKKYWQRSFIYSNENNPASERWQAIRNYSLFRYQLACNAYGEYPTKFNGGLFTYDPYFVDTAQLFTPDHRNWGGGTMTAQNQRLVYFPMFRSGDFDMVNPQLDFYNRILKNAELRSHVYWGHNGACFTEQIENFGLPNPSEYGWKRPASYDKGMEYNAWLEYQWDTALEFCLMALDLERYSNQNIAKYVPLITSCLTFFNEHYQYLAKLRGRRVFDENKHIVFYPGSACETYKMAYNAVSTTTALRVVTSRLLGLP